MEQPCNVLTCLPQVNGYPSSPFDTTKLVFSKPYRKLVTLEDSIKTGKGDIPCDEVWLHFRVSQKCVGTQTRCEVRTLFGHGR
jgi:hypothetical protein